MPGIMSTLSILTLTLYFITANAVDCSRYATLNFKIRPQDYGSIKSAPKALEKKERRLWSQTLRQEGQAVIISPATAPANVPMTRHHIISKERLIDFWNNCVERDFTNCFVNGIVQKLMTNVLNELGIMSSNNYPPRAILYCLAQGQTQSTTAGTPTKDVIALQQFFVWQPWSLFAGPTHRADHVDSGFEVNVGSITGIEEYGARELYNVNEDMNRFINGVGKSQKDKKDISSATKAIGALKLLANRGRFETRFNTKNWVDTMTTDDSGNEKYKIKVVVKGFSDQPLLNWAVEFAAFAVILLCSCMICCIGGLLIGYYIIPRAIAK